MIATADVGVLPGLAVLGDRVEVVAIASRTRSRAEAVAREWRIPSVFSTVEDMLDGAALDAVVNLTPIPDHARTSLPVVRRGVHLVSEKPLATTMEDADEIIEAARRSGALIVCAPPTMLEPSRIRVRELLAGGEIGAVAFARVRSSHAGPAWRAWPADPSWFYREGSGPLLDMGVYGIQAITGILGPARSVSALAGRTLAERIVEGGPFDGTRIPVEVDDNVILLLDHGGARFSVVDATFNVRASRSPAIEIFGTHGVIAVHDDDPGRPGVELYRAAGDGAGGAWEPATGAGFDRAQHRADSLGRGILVEHLLSCLETGRAPVLSAEHARHSLEVMLGAQESARTGRSVALRSTF